MTKNFTAAIPRGEVITLSHQSSVLRDNPLGDPSQRLLHIYLPSAYKNRRRHKKFPVLFDLAAYISSGPAHLNWRNFDENLVEKLDRLIHQKKMPHVIVAFPDCFTRLGGNQYLNSSALGAYADYLTKELVPFLDGEVSSHGSAEHRGCFGKSSGGYGAIRHAMQYPNTWGGIANHSGDAYFEFVYASQWPIALTHLHKYHKAKKGSKPTAVQAQPGLDDGRVADFLKDIYSREPNGSNPLSSNDIMTLMLLAMAATYDPDPNAPNGFNLPYDLNSGQLIKSRWRQWLRHDPINLVSRYKNNLRKMRAVFLDCGRQDQFHIHYGMRQLSAQLTQHEITHRYEEFNGTHSGIDHRLDISLPFLAKALS